MELSTFFYSFCIIYITLVGVVIYKLRANPVYEPRILFSIFSLSWMVIIYGYSVSFEGFLAAESMDYKLGFEVLSLISVVLFILGYCSFIIGASIKFKINPSNVRDDKKLLKIVSILFVFLAVINFSINVKMISGGNPIEYLLTTAGRSYQISDGLGVSAVGYMFGHIGMCVLFFIYARYKNIKLSSLLILFFIVFIIKLSQGRIFQTLVFCGSCYFSYLIGLEGIVRNTRFFTQMKGLITIFSLGLSLYILRIASAYYFMGGGYDKFSVSEFFGNIVHFAVERGNLPNIPILLTIIDKFPSESFFLSGKTIFNWLLYFMPKQFLPDDFLISMWIKKQWYSGIEGGGLPPTAIGEWYANFGPIGVCVGMFLVGLVLNHIYRLSRLSDSVTMKILWANLSFGFIIIYPKTDLSQIPVYTIFFIMLFFIAYRAFRSVLSK